MLMNRRELNRSPGRLVRSLCALACLTGFVGAAQSQVTLQVTTTAGGPTDRMARLIAPALGQALGRSVTVAAAISPGQSASIVNEVASGRADGTVLLLGDMTLVLQLRAVGVDLEKVLAIAGVVGEYPIGIVSKRGGAVQNLDQLRSALASGSSLAHSGDNTVSKRCVELIAPSLSPGATVTGYRGLAPMVADLLGDRAAAGCAVLSRQLTGNLAVLALNNKFSHPDLQGVPVSTAIPRSLGLVGVFLPSSASDATVNMVGAALRRALADANVRAKLAEDFYLDMPKDTDPAIVAPVTDVQSAPPAVSAAANAIGSTTSAPAATAVTLASTSAASVPETLLREFREIAMRPGFAPPWPRPAANSMVVMLQGRTASEWVAATWTSTFVGPARFNSWIYPTVGGSGQIVNVDVLGGLLWIGRGSATGATFSIPSSSASTVFPLRVGQTFTVERRPSTLYGGVAPASFQFLVEQRLEAFAGFEWLPGPFYVVQVRATAVPSGEVILSGRSVYSEAANVVVASVAGDKALFRVAGLNLNGQPLGMNERDASAKAGEWMRGLVADVEFSMKGTTSSSPTQAAAPRPSTTAPPQDTGVARSPGPAPSTSMPGSVSGGRVGQTAAPSAVGPLIAGSQMKLYPRVMTTTSGHQIHGTAAGLACLKLTGRRDRAGNEEVLLTCAAALVDCQLRSDPSGVDHTRPCSAQYPTQIINSRPDVYHGEPRFLLRLQPSSVFVFGYNECAWNGSMVAPVPEGWAAVCGVDLAGLQREFDNSSPHKLEQLRKSRWGF
jgi:tripartite-type tricarboxylate transporter receptor subunit TctC